MANVLDILKRRGFIYQTTNESELSKRFDNPTTFYIGFDPTADSLHVGHLLPIMGAMWLRMHGHKAIMVIGGGTAMIGDPSGKTTARPILDKETVKSNSKAIYAQLQGLFKEQFGLYDPILLNNAGWVSSMTFIDFIRDIGSQFSVPRMLAQESMRKRLETGLSFLEFSYPLMQAYDFLTLFQVYGCTVQFGGQDQWGNMVGGIDLIHRKTGGDAYAATFPLLLKSDGTKFGKTAGDAVWLDESRTSVFDYYQFWRNTDDKDVKRMLALFTMLPMDEVERLGSLEPPMLNRAKEILAYEATAFVHGHEKAIRAYKTAGNMFGFADPEKTVQTTSEIMNDDGIDGNDAPTMMAIELTPENSEDGKIFLYKVLVMSGMCNSASDARRLIKQGGCYMGGRRVTDEKQVVSKSALSFELQAGKKSRKRILLI